MDKLDWTLWLQAGNFLLLILLLERLLYRPLRAVIEQRSARLDGARQRSRELEEQIVTQQQAFDRQLTAARQEAGQARHAQLEAARQRQAQVIGAAHDAAAQQLEQVRREVAAGLDAERADLRRLATRLGDDIAARLLGRPL